VNRTTALISAALLVSSLTTACDDERATGGPSRTAARPVVDEPGGIGSADPSAAPAALPDPAAQPHGGGQAGAPPQGGPSVTGTVAETMNAGGYTYMRLETASGPVWVASMEMPVAVGNRVEAFGSVMRGFHSSTLDRTFDEIVFAGSARILEGSGAAPGPAPAHGSVPAPAHGGSAPALPPGHP